MNKKGLTIHDLSSIGIAFVVTAIVLGLGATILGNMQTTQLQGNTLVNGTIAANVSGYGLTGLNTMASYLPTIALVSVAAVVIGIILLYFSRVNK